MKYLNKFKVLLAVNLIILIAGMELSPKSKQNINIVERSESSQAPKPKANNTFLNNAIKDIKASLDNPGGKLSSVCCTYRCNGEKVISKETKKYFDNYRKKPAYSKESFLNEDTHQIDKIVQIKFNKHSDQISITYKDPNDKGKRIYCESMDE